MQRADAGWAQRLAGRLLAMEVPPRADVGAWVAGADSVCAKLRAAAASLVGQGGYRAVLTRALVLTRAEHPWLRAVEAFHGPGDGVCLLGLLEAAATVDLDEVRGGLTALVTRILLLLGAFIGRELTLLQTQIVWPELQLSEAPSGPKEATP